MTAIMPFMPAIGSVMPVPLCIGASSGYPISSTIPDISSFGAAKPGTFFQGPVVP